MQSAHYTADAICRSMGLDAFEPLGPSCVRVLLKPSFHPEVCVTVAGVPDGGPGELSVVALTGMLWRQPVLRRLPELREAVSVPADVLAEAEAGFAAAFADRDRDGRRVCVDGLAVECCRVDGGRVERFAEPVFHDTAVSEFVGRLLWRAWVACRVPGVRNALAECARYLGAEYPPQSDPERPPARRLLVLGTPEARAEYLAALRRRGVRAFADDADPTADPSA